jgi:hypothetical protein
VTVPSYKITKAALSMLTVVYASELEMKDLQYSELALA